MSMTFWDLETSKFKPSAEDLKAVLEDYATTGAAINARVVIALIKITTLSWVDISELLASALKGLEDQTRRHFPKDANEYGKVVNYLRFLLTDVIYVRR